MRDKPETPLNLLVIMADEHQARALSCAGHPLVKTPHLDRLAGAGMRFTKAYTPSPICVPARAAFATGDYVHRTGYWDNSIAYDGRVRGWGRLLQEHGIPVESIGKLHYRAAADPTGFDRQHIPMHIHAGHGMVWGSIRDPLPVLRDRPRMLGERIGAGQSSYTRYDGEVARTAIRWLGEHSRSADPWCLQVGFVAPHFPLLAPQAFFDLYPLDALPPMKLHPRDGHRLHPWLQEHEDFWSHEAEFHDEAERLRALAAYFGLCSWLDHNIGRLLATLRETGLGERTRVVYTSDHGEMAGARGLWGKGNLYEESVAVPLILAGPGIPAGTCDAPVSLLDLSLTIPHHFGIGPAELGPRPGRSLLDILRAPDPASRIIFSEYHAIGSNSGAFMIRRGRWKYIHYVGFAPELFDLEADPEETSDLAGNPGFRAIREELHRALLAICDPERVDRLAKADQRAVVERFGGIAAALAIDAKGATPAPGPELPPPTEPRAPQA